MALTELQLPTKNELYLNIRQAANEMNRLIHDWTDLAEFIGKIGTTDLDAMAVPVGAIRTDLVELEPFYEVTDFLNGTATTQTEIPATIIDKIRTM